MSLTKKMARASTMLGKFFTPTQDTEVFKKNVTSLLSKIEKTNSHKILDQLFDTINAACALQRLNAQVFSTLLDDKSALTIVYLCGLPEEEFKHVMEIMEKHNVIKTL